MSKYHDIKEEAYEANMQLPELGLVLFTFGNVSAADRDLGVFAIKPSGVPYEELSPDKMVIVDFDGKTVKGNLRPSSDTKTHAVLYKHWENIGGIVHTHSTYATAWAQAQRDIPIFGTTHADHNTVDIPCAPPMNDEMIKGNYEYETGFQIMNCFKEKGLNYEEVEMILVEIMHHLPGVKQQQKQFITVRFWKRLHRWHFLPNRSIQMHHVLKDALIKKHFERKHGPDTYYGQ